MYRFRRERISVLTVVDRRRRKNNGLYPVKIEVVYRRTQRYYPTGKDVSLEEWATMWNAKRLSDKCISIEKSFNMIRTAVESLADKGEFCFDALDARLGRIMLTLNGLLRKKMEDLMKRGKVNSYYRYRNTLRAIESYGGANIHFDTINVKWLQKCEDHWRKGGKGMTTINIYMKTLRSMLNEALEAGAIRESQFPFNRNGYRIPSGTRREMAMTKEQIARVKAWTGDEDVEYWRDLWMFSYLCNGINFRDMLFLKYKNIVNGEIRFIRSKTSGTSGRSKFIHVSISPQMAEIIQKRGNKATGDGNQYIFKHAKGNEDPMQVSMLTRKAIHKCNDAMKKIAADLGIPPFSTYSARHSFATILKDNGADILFISECLGHSSLSMTQNYLARYSKEDRLKYSRVLLD